MGDHTESVQMEYDPTQTTYQNLLEMFWANIHPTSKSYSRQYMAAIFYHNKEQEDMAKKSRDQLQVKLGQKVTTVIAAAETFYVAEGYHQKYQLQKHQDLFKSFHFTNDKEMVNSYAASRLNGFMGGNGTFEGLLKEIDKYGLDKKMQEKVKQYVKNHNSPGESCGKKY